MDTVKQYWSQYNVWLAKHLPNTYAQKCGRVLTIWTAAQVLALVLSWVPIVNFIVGTAAFIATIYAVVAIGWPLLWRVLATGGAILLLCILTSAGFWTTVFWLLVGWIPGVLWFAIELFMGRIGKTKDSMESPNLLSKESLDNLAKKEPKLADELRAELRRLFNEEASKGKKPEAADATVDEVQTEYNVQRGHEVAAERTSDHSANGTKKETN